MSRTTTSMRQTALPVLLGIIALTCGCGASGNAGPLPATIEHAQAGDALSDGPCSSWLSPGIDAAFCPEGLETPAASGEPVGQIEFKGTPRSAAQGGIAQAGGVLPEGGTIGINVDSPVTGTLVAHALCGPTLVRATFDSLRFDTGDSANLAVLRVGDTPVIMLTLNGRKLAPTRETLIETSLPWFVPLADDGPSGCAFRVA